MEVVGAISYSNLSILSNTSLNDTNDGSTSSPSQRLLLWVILDGIIGFLGITGNGLVLLVFFRNKSSRNLINLFIINQSMIDFTSSLVFLAIHLGPRFHLVPGNRGHLILCKIWVSEYVMWALLISSSVNLICITLERYLATVKPIWYRKKVASIKRRIVPLAGAVWCAGIVVDAFWAHVQHVIPGGLCVPIYKSVIWQGVGGILIFSVTYFIPLTVMTFCYYQIIRKLRSQESRVQSQSPARNLSRNVEVNVGASGSGGAPNTLAQSSKKSTGRSTIKSRAMKNVLKTMMTVSITYAIAWAPIAINYVIFNLGGPLDFTSTWYEVTKLFAYSNMCGNPVIYAMQYRQFQVGLKAMFCGCKNPTIGSQNNEMSVSRGETNA